MADETQLENDGSEMMAALLMPDLDGDLSDPSPQKTVTELIDPREANRRRQPVAEDNVTPLRRPGDQNRAADGKWAEGRKPGEQKTQATGHNEADDGEDLAEGDGATPVDAAAAGDFLEFDPIDEGGEPERVPLSEVGNWRGEITRLKSDLEQARRDAIPAEEWDRQMDQTAQTRHQLLQTIAQLRHMIMPPEPDIRLLDPNNPNMDTAQFYAQKTAYDAARERLQRVEALGKEQEGEATKAADMRRNVALAREQEKLARVWPEIKEQATQKAVLDMAQRYGYSAEELNNWIDHRGFAVLRDAMAYHRMKSQRQAAVKVVRGAPKLVRAQARNTQSRQQQAYETGSRRLAQSGSLDDAATALAGLGF